MDRVILRKPVTCWACQHTVDDLLGVGTNHPKPQGGDVYFCVCGKISIWLGATELRKPTYEEALEARDALALALGLMRAIFE